MGIELGPFGDTTDVHGWRLMGKGQQFLPGRTLWFLPNPSNREIPPLQGSMRRRPGRKHRETALKILSRRKPPGNVTRLATAVEGPRNKSFAHVLSLHSLICTCLYHTLLLLPALCTIIRPTSRYFLWSWLTDAVRRRASVVARTHFKVLPLVFPIPLLSLQRV